jgi:dCMP deaminase
MSIAYLISARSNCERLHVGCVLVKNNRIISVGYNGFLLKAPHISRVRNGHEQSTVHSELNAICHAAKEGISLEGAIAYITHYPCIHCFKSLISSGIKDIKYSEDYKNDEYVEIMSQENNISINKIPSNE